MRDLKRVGGMTMKTMIAAMGGLVLGLASVGARADTVVSITQYSYDYMNRPICTAVRMNMAVGQPADPCTPSTTVSTDGPDRISKNVYDAAGQLLAVYQGVGTSDIRQYAYYNYTNNGLKAFEIDANHNKTTFTYDGFDRLSKVQYPNTTAGNEISSTTDYETFGYDANSNRTSYRHRNAQTVAYTYDNLNREIFKDLPAYAGSTATSKDIYTGYDGLGHIVYKRFASASGAGVSYTYDGLGRVTSTADINGRSIWYGYFADSTRGSLVFPDSQAQYYNYTNTGALNWTGISGSTVGIQHYYDSLGHVTALGRNSGAHSYYGYNNVGRLAVVSHDFTGTGNDITWSFNAFNAAGQITNWNTSTAVYDYVETATDQTNKTYDGLNRDAAIAAVTGGYDTAGNMANDGVRTFTYDVENRLITGSSALTALALNYDPEGRLYSYSYNGSTTSFLYDGTNLIGEYDGAGAMTRRYMHTLGTDQPWVQFTGSAVTAANATYLYSNYQGSIIATADQNGNVTDLFKYGPYGEPRNSANAESWTGNRFRYTGQTVIPEAKLYYYKARVYDPVAGRFLQTDPVGSDDDINLYAYVSGDPVNHTDPTGQYLESAIDVALIIADGVDIARNGLNWENGTSMAANVVGLALPGATGLGLGTRAISQTIKAADKASDVAKAAAKTCCFVGGTQVSTKDGLKAIEQIKVGDLVLSKDEATGEMAFKPVTDLIQRHDRLIYEVTVKAALPTGESRTTVFKTTDDHPWRTKDGRWLTTLELKSDVIIQSAYGSGVEVVSVVNTGKATKTYNLEVADFHTYFVGEDRVWVHNACNYEVPGSRTKSGKPYYGETGKSDPSKRPGNGKDGRERHAGDKTKDMTGTTQRQRQVQETKDINKAGGLKETDNQRNPVAPKFWEKFGIKPPGS